MESYHYLLLLLQVIIKKREKEYYHPLFLEKASNPKEVFRITNAMLARNNISPLPKCSSLTELANGLNDFFVDEITIIRDNIINTHFNGIQPTPVEPVSELDLSYVSKLVERFAANQLVDHVTQNGLSEKFQSAYRTSHSTETALTCVRNDIHVNMDR